MMWPWSKPKEEVAYQTNNAWYPVGTFVDKRNKIMRVNGHRYQRISPHDGYYDVMGEVVIEMPKDTSDYTMWVLCKLLNAAQFKDYHTLGMYLDKKWLEYHKEVLG